jgi:hypothetical protein
MQCSNNGKLQCGFNTILALFLRVLRCTCVHAVHVHAPCARITHAIRTGRTVHTNARRTHALVVHNQGRKKARESCDQFSHLLRIGYAVHTIRLPTREIFCGARAV